MLEKSRASELFSRTGESDSLVGQGIRTVGSGIAGVLSVRKVRSVLSAGDTLLSKDTVERCVAESVYRHVFDINVLGVFLSQKYEIPAMLKSGGGVIINTSSILGQIAMPGAAVYNASKHAVEGITKTTALELAERGIRVNSVATGAIATDMIDRFAITTWRS